MSIRAKAIAVCVLVWFLAGCRTDTPTPLPAATPLRTPTAPSTPTPLAVPTPVPIATWVAQGIPSDMEITYTSSNRYTDLGDDIRITADGSATRSRSGVQILLPDGRTSSQYAGKLPPDVLKRVVLAFDDQRFFYLEQASGGCVNDIAESIVERESITDMDDISISIRMNGISKMIQWYSGCTGSEGGSHLRALSDIIRDAVKNLPVVIATEDGTLVPIPTVTPVVIPCEIFQPLGDRGWIWDIEIGDDGAIWIAANDGAARLDPQSGEWTVFGESQGLPVGSVRFVTPDMNGTVWLAFWHGPLYHFNGERWDRFARSDQIQADDVLAISIAPDASVWVGTTNGAYRWDRESDIWRHYTEADGLHGNIVSDILFTPDGKVWFASIGGVSYLDQANLAGRGEVWWSRDSNILDEYSPATTSEDGKVWFTGERYFDVSSQSWADTVYLYKGRRAVDIAVDSRGGLWIGTEQGATYIPDPDHSPVDAWQSFTTINGLGGNDIRSLAIEDDDSVWFGAENATVTRCHFKQ